MSPPISSSRKFARRILLLALVLSPAAAAIWWSASRQGDSDDKPARKKGGGLIELPAVERPLMGTAASIKVFAPDEESGRRAIAAAFARGEEINAICTDYDPKSELMRLSKAGLHTPIRTSLTLTAVLAHARATAELTEGAFDPSLGPLTRLWRQSRRDKALPAGEVLADALQRSGWQHFEVNPPEQYVILKKEGMQFDLGGIAKGYAADEMMRVLQEHGIHIATITIGGDLRLGAPPPGKRAWRVGIKTLGPDLTQFIEVANCAVSTSGDLHQFVEIDGVRYSHIIDPSTGLGITTRIAATVVAPTGVQSDPLATFCCLRPEESLRIFEAGEIACRIVTLKGEQPSDRATRQFPPIHGL